MGICVGDGLVVFEGVVFDFAGNLVEGTFLRVVILEGWKSVIFLLRVLP